MGAVVVVVGAVVVVVGAVVVVVGTVVVVVVGVVKMLGWKIIEPCECPAVLYALILAFHRLFSLPSNRAGFVVMSKLNAFTVSSHLRSQQYISTT